MVVRGSACPSSFCASNRFLPRDTSLLANVCRRSWIRTLSGIPAFFRITHHARDTVVYGFPVAGDGKRYGDLPSETNCSITHRALSFSGRYFSFFDFVL